MNSTYVQLKKNLEYLKLNQMDLHLDEVIDLITSSPLNAHRLAGTGCKTHHRRNQQGRVRPVAVQLPEV